MNEKLYELICIIKRLLVILPYEVINFKDREDLICRCRRLEKDIW